MAAGSVQIISTDWVEITNGLAGANVSMHNYQGGSVLVCFETVSPTAGMLTGQRIKAEQSTFLKTSVTKIWARLLDANKPATLLYGVF